MALYIGIMSGTSLDGIDVALVSIEGDNTLPIIRCRAARTTPFSSALLTDLQQMMIQPVQHVAHVGAVQNQLAHEYALAVNQLLHDTQLDASDIHAIGCHGQTIWHAPDADSPYSIQLNNAALLAANTGIAVIDNFRAKDLALQGQGAPLVPAFHHALLHDLHSDRDDSHDQQTRAVINIGGIANVTLLPAQGLITDVLGFDTGPGNTLLDTWCLHHTGQTYDKDGEWGASGNVDNALLQQMLSDPYFAIAGPKSSGREYFNRDWVLHHIMAICADDLAPCDVQATLVQLTAHTIARSLHHAKNETAPQSIADSQWIICGGGAHNPYLMLALKALAPSKTHVIDMQTLGIDSDALEAMAFAWLAFCYEHRLRANLPHVTGAQRPVILGSKTQHD